VGLYMCEGRGVVYSVNTTVDLPPKKEKKKRIFVLNLSSFFFLLFTLLCFCDYITYSMDTTNMAQYVVYLIY
jgi:hypothetical protein